MHCLTSLPDRRGFLRLAFSVAGGAMLSGCGGSSSAATGGVTVVPPTGAIAAASPVAPVAAAATSPLNLALTLAYAGAQFYGIAANGAGLPASATTGSGRQGVAGGARQVAFADPVVAAHAADLAADKLSHVVALRAQLSALVAAQPAIDLSAASGGGFATAAARAGLGSLDPYADDTGFLLAAFLLENRVAAAYRPLLAGAGDDASAALIAGNLSDAIFHGGVIRTLLADRAASDPAVDAAMTSIGAMLATLDGSDVGDQTLAGASGASIDIPDAEGRPIAFTRDTSQVLRALYLSTGAAGGFFPAGVNGIAV